MLSKVPKLRHLRKKNYLKDRERKSIIYPTLNNKSDNINTKDFNTNINSTGNRKTNTKKTFIRTTTGFLDRNYNNYMSKIFQRNNEVNKSMLQTHQLNTLLYKLKKYNNELHIYNRHKLNSLNILKDNLKKDTAKLKKLIDLQDIDLPDEKISIKNFNEIKLSKEDMERKLHVLMFEKQNIDYSLKSEEEYNRTIEYMLENEQNRLFSIKKESYNIEEKIQNIYKYQKIIQYNMNINDKEEEKYSELNKEILNDIDLVQKVESQQNLTKVKIQAEISQKENEIKELEDIIEGLKAYKNTDFKTSKDELKDKIENLKELERKRIRDEKKCIDIIYCLYVIQKYLYEEKNYDKNKIIQSDEYQLLQQLNNEDYIIMKTGGKKIKKEENKTYSENMFLSGDNLLGKESKRQFDSILSSSKKNKNLLNTDNTTEDAKFNQTTKYFSNNISFNKGTKSSRNIKSSSLNKIGNKTQLTFFQSYIDIISFYSEDKNKLNELITKFKSIKITKNEILNYISSLLSKLEFYGAQMNILHYKELSLEDMKGNYEKKVKDIISNNYFSFEELTKNNSRCKEFLEKNEYYINQMKKNNNKILSDKILEQINKKYEVVQSEENNSIDDNNKNEINEDNILFTHSKNIIMSIKNFFLTCSDLLKNIIYTTNTKSSNSNLLTEKKMTSTNKTEDINDILLKENNPEDNNIYNRTYKKLEEFLNNKEIIISDDYKLLLQYIKNLIKFCRDNTNVISKEDFDDINTNLLEKFYIPGNIDQMVDKVFMNRFLAKKNRHYNNIYIHFISLADQVAENVKEIYNLINSKENEKYLEETKDFNNRFSEEDIYNNNINLKNTKRVIQSSSNNNESQSIEVKSGKKRKAKKLRSANSVNIISNNDIDIDKFKELCEDEEEKETVETQSTQKIVIKKKRRNKSVDDNIINNLYTPFLKKTVYLRQLNPNIPGIKQKTTSSSKTYHDIKKRIGEVNIITHQMKIFNNPYIDTNKLCNNTYNSLVKLINKSNRAKKVRQFRYRITGQ